MISSIPIEIPKKCPNSIDPNGMFLNESIKAGN